jgi:DNA helicase-2/ATP-dependent DNA helicase PcrA
LIGASEGILPLISGGTSGGASGGTTSGPASDALINEERRLFYVGMTRAKADLHLSYRGEPSRFLRESTLLS